MAVRYLRASGSWNGPVWSATLAGAPGSASVPGPGDTAYVNYQWTSSFSITLDQDVVVDALHIYAGTFNALSYDVRTTGITSFATNSNVSSLFPTVNMGSGVWEMRTATAGNLNPFSVGGNAVVNPGTSQIILHGSGISTTLGEAKFTLSDKTYNDVILLMDRFNGGNATITGSPTFRSLTIQSKNSSAHTVNVSGRIKTDKFIGMGSSSANKLVINGDQYVPGGVAPFELTNSGTSYGQYLDLRSVFISNSPNSVPYAGSNSVADVFSTGWLLQNPHKASTLIDEFTSLSSSRWETQAVGSGYVNVSGGSLNMGWAGGSAYTRITSKDTYDLVNETVYLKVTSSTGGIFMNVSPVAVRAQAATILGTNLVASGERFWRVTSTVSGDTATLSMGWFDNGTWVETYTQTVAASQLRSVRFDLSGTRNMSSTALVVDSVGVGPFPTQPVADFSATPTSGKRPVTVQFTDLTKGIPDTWSWNFGDGYTSTQQNPSHPYSKAGTYTVSLTASNIEGTDTVTKSALITIQPEVFSRTAGGTFLLGGDTNRRLIASRTAGGTFLLGGETRIVLIRDAEAIQDKTYLYKVYDPDGNFIEVWKDVADEPQFTHEINSIGSSMTVELARNSDTVGTTTSPILDDDGQAILDDTELPILGSMETRNQIGAGTSVDYNNRVDIVAFYGSIEPLYDDEMEEILDDNDEAIITEIGAPNGRRIFTGFISEINSRYGNTESTVVQLTSYGFDLDQYPITTAYNNNTTTVPFNSFDPSEIAQIAVDRFYQAANLEQVSYTKRTTDSIATTGTQVSYTFRNNTYKEVLDKVLELMPSDWYYRVGLGDNTVYFRERSNTPQHIFYLGKHIKSLDLKGSIMDVTNHVLFTGGGDPALYIEEKQEPAARTRRGLEVLSDSRVTQAASARIIAQGKIDAGNKMQNRSTIEILAKQYNIEEIQVGHVIGFRNFNSYVDNLELIVAGVSYSPDIVQLSLQRLPPTVNKRLSDLHRNLAVQESNNIPTTPS